MKQERNAHEWTEKIMSVHACAVMLCFHAVKEINACE